MQGIYSCIPETRHVSGVYTRHFGAILYLIFWCIYYYYYYYYYYYSNLRTTEFRVTITRTLRVIT